MRRLGWALLGALVFAGCASLQSRITGTGGDVLRVGTSGSYPPFSMKKGSTLQGIEPDFAAALGRELKRPVRLVEVPFPDLIGELNAGRIDLIMAGMSKTAEREALVGFTKPYLRVGQMLLLRKSDDAELAGISWLYDRGRRVGFERATTGARFVRDKLVQCEPMEYASKEDAIVALRAGDVDAVVHDAPFVWSVTGSPHEPSSELAGRFAPLTDELLAWAVRKGNTELRVSLNRVLARWRESGELDAILDRWMKVRRVTKKIRD